MRVSEIHFYPLKSGRGIALQEADIVAEGIPGDRRMMVADPCGQFITQRELPALARLSVRPEAEFLRFAMDGRGEIRVSRPSPDRRTEVVVWKSTVNAALADDATNRTLSDWLGRAVQLVFFDDRASRAASAEWAGPETPVTFADGYQVLITMTASLAALNADMRTHGEGEVGMERFRPNVVVETEEPWMEDRWASITIGAVAFDLVKPCARCIMTTQDQQTGSREGPSPIPAMGRIRMSADRRVPGPLFGWNAVPRSGGRLRIGDTVTVTEQRPQGWAIKTR